MFFHWFLHRFHQLEKRERKEISHRSFRRVFSQKGYSSFGILARNPTIIPTSLFFIYSGHFDKYYFMNLSTITLRNCLKKSTYHQISESSRIIHNFIQGSNFFIRNYSRILFRNSTRMFSNSFPMKFEKFPWHFSGDISVIFWKKIFEDLLGKFKIKMMEFLQEFWILDNPSNGNIEESPRKIKEVSMDKFLENFEFSWKWNDLWRVSWFLEISQIESSKKKFWE